MTKQEHRMMILMFARMFEALTIVTETLKRSEIWTGDDERAFSHATHSDLDKLRGNVLQAHQEYLDCAARSGVVTGLETEPPPQ
jgi:hypothetical protein